MRGILTLGGGTAITFFAILFHTSAHDYRREELGQESSPDAPFIQYPYSLVTQLLGIAGGVTLGHCYARLKLNGPEEFQDPWFCIFISSAMLSWFLGNAFALPIKGREISVQQSKALG